jgi:hypothetical protein
MKYPKQTILVFALLGLFSHQLIQPALSKAASVLEAFAPANTSLTTKIHMQYTDLTGYTDEDWLTFYYDVDPENGPNAE